MRFMQNASKLRRQTFNSTAAVCFCCWCWLHSVSYDRLWRKCTEPVRPCILWATWNWCVFACLITNKNLQSSCTSLDQLHTPFTLQRRARYQCARNYIVLRFHIRRRNVHSSCNLNDSCSYRTWSIAWHLAESRFSRPILFPFHLKYFCFGFDASALHWAAISAETEFRIDGCAFVLV